MTWTLFAIGKPKLAFARAGVEEYALRMRPLASVKLEWLKSGTRESESAQLLQRSEGMFRIALDERGEQFSSRAFAARIAGWEQQSIKSVALLIGGADGHTETVRQCANAVWSLSTLTLQHELAIVVLFEQIYRAYSIKAGLPYHRD